MNGVVFKMGMRQYCGAVLPLLQLSVWVTAVNCDPATAVPLTVLQTTVAGPLALPVRLTATISRQDFARLQNSPKRGRVSLRRRLARRHCQAALRD